VAKPGSRRKWNCRNFKKTVQPGLQTGGRAEAAGKEMAGASRDLSMDWLSRIIQIRISYSL